MTQPVDDDTLPVDADSAPVDDDSPPIEEAILDRMTDAFFALDTDCRFTYLNERGESVIANAAADDVDPPFLGRSIWDVVPDAVDTVFYNQYTGALETQETRSFEAYYAPLDTWFDVHVYPSDSGLSVYFQDVTDRREHRERLERRERVLRDIYEVTADKDRSFEEKIDALLQLGQDVLGTEYAALSRVSGDDYVFEVVHDPDGETRPGDVVSLSETNCERAILTEETLVLEDIASDAPVLAQRAGFTEQGVECYLGTPVFVDGEVYGTFCFYDRDPRVDGFTNWEVTLVELLGNWVSYEQERVYHQRSITRERNRLDDLVSVVSHDLRNPLNTASGFLTVAREEDDPDALGRVDTALERMNELIDDLLTMARSGGAVTDPDEVDLAGLLDESWQTAATPAATLNTEALPATIRGDESRLKQLFENLFRNSIEHGRPDVSVTVGALSDQQGFYVADDGPGLGDNPVAVVEHGYTTNEDGTGFGLSIVEEIAAAHGATVTPTNGHDGGARFEFTGFELY